MPKARLKLDKELAEIDRLIDWYVNNRPNAGQIIPVDKGPKRLARILTREVSQSGEYAYRGRILTAVGIDKTREPAPKPA